MLPKHFDPYSLALNFVRLGRYLPERLRGAFYWRLFCTPILHSRKPEQLAFLDRGRPFFVPSGQDYLLSGWSFAGPGRTAVLVHGWQGSAASWHVIAPILLDAGYRVIVYNAPGHHNRPVRSSLPDFTQGLIDIVELFGADVLVGHSFGAMAAARMASSLPDLKSLVLISSPNDLFSLAFNFTKTMEMNEHATANFLARLASSTGSNLSDETVTNYLQGVHCPILVIHDEDDDVIPYQNGQTIAESCQASFWGTESLGHRQIVREPSVAHRIRDFLESVLSGG